MARAKFWVCHFWFAWREDPSTVWAVPGPRQSWSGSHSYRAMTEGCLRLQPSLWEPLYVVILRVGHGGDVLLFLFHLVQKLRALGDISFNLLLPYLVSFSQNFYGKSVILICFP